MDYSIAVSALSGQRAPILRQICRINKTNTGIVRLFLRHIPRFARATPGPIACQSSKRQTRGERPNVSLALLSSLGGRVWSDQGAGD